MTEAFQTNPFARGLVEQEQEEVTEGKGLLTRIKDHRGDMWKLVKNLVRNRSHPNYNKPHEYAGMNHVPQPPPVHAWHNERTGEVHEGSMRVNSDGTGSPDSEYSSRYHISHYNKVAKGSTKAPWQG